MAEYCTFADVQNRLTEAGLNYCADRNRSGAVEPSEQAKHVTTSIAYAGGKIDIAVINSNQQLDPIAVRAQANIILRDIAIDIAVERVCGLGGHAVPPSVAEAAARSKDELVAFMNGKTIPYLTYPTQRDGSYSLTQPAVVNPCGRRW